MATDELTQEEKNKAAGLKKEAEKEKNKLDEIGGQLTSISDLIKSHVDKKEKDDETELEVKEIDFEKLNAAELAKSFGEDTEKAKDFIKELTEACGVNPEEMYDIDGYQYIDEEMLKSLEDAQSKGENYLAGIMLAMRETNERNAIKDNVIMQTISLLTKSITEQNEIIKELQKSVKKDEEKKEGKEKKDGIEMPSLDADDPLSELNDIDLTHKSVTSEDLLSALKKSFPGKHGDVEEQQKYNIYAEFAERMDVETALDWIGRKSRSDLDLVQSNLVC